MDQTHDSHSHIDQQTLACTGCGADHSKRCADCGGRGSHEPGCATRFRADVRARLDELVGHRERLEGCIDLMIHQGAADGYFSPAEREQIREIIDEQISHMVKFAELLDSPRDGVVAIPSRALTSGSGCIAIDPPNLVQG